MINIYITCLKEYKIPIAEQDVLRVLEFGSSRQLDQILSLPHDWDFSFFDVFDTVLIKGDLDQFKTIVAHTPTDQITPGVLRRAYIQSIVNKGFDLGKCHHLLDIGVSHRDAVLQYKHPKKKEIYDKMQKIFEDWADQND